MELIVFSEISTGLLVGIIIGCILLGLVAGFFVSRWFFKRELKKNPPINENMIRAMFMQMVPLSAFSHRAFAPPAP